jgi:hypothetical protein
MTILGVTSNPDPRWQHGFDEWRDPQFYTNPAEGYIEVDVDPGENLGDLTRRVFGTNTEVGRQRILDATNGVVRGKIRIPK